MVLNYWDLNYWYGKLNKFFFRDTDPVDGELDDHVASLQADMKTIMGTDDEGVTWPAYIWMGMHNYANSLGYQFGDGVNWTGHALNWHWAGIKTTINKSWPFVFSASDYPKLNGGTFGHSVAAVGYDNDKEDVLVYTTWSTNGNTIQRVHHSFGLFDVTGGASPAPGGPIPYDVKVTYPTGDHAFAATGSFGTLPRADSARITWSNFGAPGDHVDLYYSINGGRSWVFIASAPDNESYLWHVPDIATSLGRIRIKQFSTPTTIASEDGSYGNFTIEKVLFKYATVQSYPAGLSFYIDSVAYSSPQTFRWVAGTQHLRRAPLFQYGEDGAQYMFSSWSDTGTGAESGAIKSWLPATDNLVWTVNFAPVISWVGQAVGTGGLYAVCFTDSNNGTAVQATDYIRRTTDGGTVWWVQGRSSLFTYSLFSVSFFDAYRGITVGNHGTILSTVDRGFRWTEEESGTTQTLLGVSFKHPYKAVAVGENGTILRRDSLRHWIPVRHLPQATLRAVSMASADTGFVVGGLILRTTDAGATWTQQLGGTWRFLRAVCFTDVNTGTAVGDSGVILRTTNGGATWSNQFSGTTEILDGVSFSDTNYGTVVGTNGTILRTTDGGATWASQKIRTLLCFYGVSFPGRNIGAIVGPFGAMLRPADILESADERKTMAGMPKETLLEQNYPNPFNPRTTIKFELPRASQVHLSVFDILGREVSVLVNEKRDAGVHEVKFNGSGLASGMYFYRLQAGDFVQTRKFCLIR